MDIFFIMPLVPGLEECDSHQSYYISTNDFADGCPGAACLHVGRSRPPRQSLAAESRVFRLQFVLCA
jgi:hypothetical protein